MATLVIRRIEETLLKKVRHEAVDRGISLRELVIEKLGGAHGEGADSGAVESKRGAAVGTRGRRKAEVAGRGAEPDRVESTARRVGVRLDAVSEGGGGTGKVSVETAAPAPKKLVKTCPHGTEKGWKCGLCGGLAKVGE